MKIGRAFFTRVAAFEAGRMNEAKDGRPHLDWQKRDWTHESGSRTTKLPKIDDGAPPSFDSRAVVDAAAAATATAID